MYIVDMKTKQVSAYHVGQIIHATPTAVSMLLARNPQLRLERVWLTEWRVIAV